MAFERSEKHLGKFHSALRLRKTRTEYSEKAAMDALRKQASKIREQVAKQQQVLHIHFLILCCDFNLTKEMKISFHWIIVGIFFEFVGCYQAVWWERL